jgi:hypothetical protein
MTLLSARRVDRMGGGEGVDGRFDPMPLDLVQAAQVDGRARGLVLDDRTGQGAGEVGAEVGQGRPLRLVEGGDGEGVRLPAVGTEEVDFAGQARHRREIAQAAPGDHPRRGGRQQGERAQRIDRALEREGLAGHLDDGGDRAVVVGGHQQGRGPGELEQTTEQRLVEFAAGFGQIAQQFGGPHRGGDAG